MTEPISFDAVKVQADMYRQIIGYGFIILMDTRKDVVLDGRVIGETVRVALGGIPGSTMIWITYEYGGLRSPSTFVFRRRAEKDLLERIRFVRQVNRDHGDQS